MLASLPYGDTLVMADACAEAEQMAIDSLPSVAIDHWQRADDYVRWAVVNKIALGWLELGYAVDRALQHDRDYLRSPPPSLSWWRGLPIIIVREPYTIVGHFPSEPLPGFEFQKQNPA